MLVPGDHGFTEVAEDEFLATLVPRLPLGERLFQRGGRLVQITGEPGSRAARPVDPEHLKLLIAQAVRLIRTTREGQVFTACSTSLARFVKSNLAASPETPELRSMSTYPVWVHVRAGWRISEPGYDANTGHYYDQPEELRGLSMRPLAPDASGRQRARDAIRTFILGDIPFKGEPDRVNALAAMLTLMMRPGLTPAVPCFAVLSQQNRVGKTMLCSAIVEIVTGMSIPQRAFPVNEYSVQQAILAALRQQPPALLWDNLPQGSRIDSAALAAFLTSEKCAGRVFGTHDDESHPNLLVPFATGRGPTFSHELSTRMVPIELLYREGNPEERPGLPPIGGEIERHRLEVLETLHGMIAAWVEDGAPSGPDQAFGGYESWYRTVGGVLQLFGLHEHFLANVRGWRERSNEERSDRKMLLWHWERAGLSGRFVPARELADVARNAELYPEVFARALRSHVRSFAKVALSDLVGGTFEFGFDDGSKKRYRIAARSIDNMLHYCLSSDTLAEADHETDGA